MTGAEGVALPLAVGLRREEVLRFLGYPAGREPTARVVAALDAALDTARAQVEARGVYRRLPAFRAADAHSSGEA